MLKTVLAALAYYSGAFLLLRLLHRRMFGPGIKILYYHRVSAKGESDLLGQHLLTAEAFEKHLRHLRRFYHVIRLEEAAEYLASGRAFPSNSAVITFDDGYRDNFTVAFPLLRRKGLPATLFVVSGAIDGTPLWLDQVGTWFRDTSAATLRFGWIGTELSLKTPSERRQALKSVRSVLKSLPGAQLPQALAELRTQLGINGPDCQPEDSAMLNWDELRSMSASGLITVGAHTVTHRLLPTLDRKEMELEVEESCRRLAQELRQPIGFFAYPGGAYNPAAKSVARKARLVACANGGGGFNPAGSDLTALRRLGAEGIRQSQLALYLAGWEDLRDMFLRKLGRVRRTVKRLLYSVMEIAGLFPLLRYLNRRRILVLLYHGVSSFPSTKHLNDLHVPEEQFRRQMRWLRRKFTPISLDQAIAALDGREPWPRRAVLITFDDAYRNNLEVAWPILKECGFQPTIFVPTGFPGSGRISRSEDVESRIKNSRALGVRLNDRWLWLRSGEERQAAFQQISLELKRLETGTRERVWKEVQKQLSESDNVGATCGLETRLSWAELQAARLVGIDVGSHTISHAQLRGLPKAEMQKELEGSKKELELRLKTPILAFAYPNGDWSHEVRRLVQSAGYSCAFTAQPGTNGPLTDRFLLHRVPINARDSFGEFKSAVSGFSRCGMAPACKVLEISNYPPPECGWARQTKFLAEELAKRGARCEVLNINESRKIKDAEYVDVQNGADYLLKVMGFALRGYRLHTHVNAESSKGYALAIIANLIARVVGRPAVMTFHGGLPQTYFPRMDSPFLKWAYLLLFSSAGSIICNSTEIVQAIQAYGTNGVPIVAIPGFSRQYLQFQRQQLGDRVEAFLARHNPTFFCFVCYRPEYRLDVLHEGMQKFLRRWPKAGFVWLGFPAKELPQVEAFLGRRATVGLENLLLLGNLDHDTFLSLLARCFAYVRPAACDGVSASVLESIALRVPVIAAENGRRPQGVVTFRFGDADDLCAKLERVVENYDDVKRATTLRNVEDNIQRTADWVLACDTSEKNSIDVHVSQN